MSYTTLTDFVRAQGMSTLLERDTASAVFSGLSHSKTADYLGLLLLGEAYKTDSMKTTLRQYAQNNGTPLVVDDNAKGQEIGNSSFAETAFELVGYKETRTFHADEMRLLYEANRNNCTDATLERAVNMVEEVMRELVERYMLFREKPFWEGVFGAINYQTQAGTTLSIATNTTQLPALVGAQQWINHVSATPLEDINMLKTTMRDTGFTPTMIVMNGRTYAELMETQQFQDAQGMKIYEYRLEGMPLQTLMGMELKVYDGYYTDATGTKKRFIEDGKIAILGSTNDTKIGARLYDAFNVDSRNEVIYGAYQNVITGDNPRLDAYFQSYYGGPVFTHPQAFASLTVF